MIATMDGGAVELADELEPHPLVMQFPAYNDEQLDELAEDLVRRGGSVTLLKRGGLLLDDVNRLRACQRAGVPVLFSEWDGTGSLAETIAKAILPRNPLSESQRAAVAVPISDLLASETTPVRHANLLRSHPSKMAIPCGEQKNTKTAFLEKSTETANLQLRLMSKSCSSSSMDKNIESPIKTAAAVAAKWCGVSERYVYAARSLRDADRGLFDQVRLGKLNLNEARVAVSKKLRKAQLNVQDIFSKRSQPGEDQIIVGDCLHEMGRMKDGLFDLIFADPPYNLGLKYHADPTHDAMPPAAYLSWSERWIKQCARLLTPTGSIWIMIDGNWQGRFDVALRNAGLTHRRTVVWHDNFPNHTETNFQPAARFLLYFTRSPKTWTFNADAVRVESARDRGGDTRRTHEKGIVPHDVWEDINRTPGNSADRVPWDDAPPQVPSKLLERIILATSRGGDRVFDPFTGNGTTWREARRLGRKFTGIERSPLYAEQARKWALGGK